MRNQLVAAVALTVITSGLACARSEPPRRPEIPRSATAAPPPTADLDRLRAFAAGANPDPVPETIRGFEGQALHPPDRTGGGPAADSDVGGTKWRNSPGTFSENPGAADTKKQLQEKK